MPALPRHLLSNKRKDPERTTGSESLSVYRNQKICRHRLERLVQINKKAPDADLRTGALYWSE